MESPQDPAVDADKQYLVDRGPSPTLDVAAPDRSVLEALRQLEEDKATLVREAAQLRARVAELNQQSERVAKELEREKNTRIAAESERDDVRKKLGEQQSRLLSVAIDRARLEQELLESKIAAMDKKRPASGASRSETSDPWATPAAPPHGEK